MWLLTSSRFLIVWYDKSRHVLHSSTSSPSLLFLLQLSHLSGLGTNPLWFLADWTQLPLQLCRIWLLQLNVNVCWWRFFMKTDAEPWSGARMHSAVAHFSGSNTLILSWSPPESQDKGHMPHILSGKLPDVWPCRPPAMFTILTSVIQRSELVIKPHNKHTTHWADW